MHTIICPQQFAQISESFTWLRHQIIHFVFVPGADLAAKSRSVATPRLLKSFWCKKLLSCGSWFGWGFHVPKPSRSTSSFSDLRTFCWSLQIRPQIISNPSNPWLWWGQSFEKIHLQPHCTWHRAHESKDQEPEGPFLSIARRSILPSLISWGQLWASRLLLCAFEGNRHRGHFGICLAFFHWSLTFHQICCCEIWNNLLEGLSTCLCGIHHNVTLLHESGKVTQWKERGRVGESHRFHRLSVLTSLRICKVSSECRCLRKPLLSCFPGVAEEIGFALWGLVWHPCGEPHECPARNGISKWDGRLSTLRRDDDGIWLQGVSQHGNVQHVTRVTESMIIIQALAWFIQISKWLLPETQIVWSCCRNVSSQIQKGKVMLMLTRVSRIGTKANPDQSHRWCLSPEKQSKALAHLFLGNKTKARQRKNFKVYKPFTVLPRNGCRDWKASWMRVMMKMKRRTSMRCLSWGSCVYRHPQMET